MKRNKIGIWLVVCLMSILVLSACEGVGSTKQTADKGSSGDGGNVNALLFYCDSVSDRQSYDLDDVTLTFTFGFKSRERAKESFYRTYIINAYPAAGYEESVFDVYSRWQEEGFPDVPVCLYVSSFGHKTRLKSVSALAFFTEEYADKNHSEGITIPAELFYNEYGLMEFELGIPDEEDVENTTLGGSGCKLYYKKEGRTVQISDVDLMPTYRYHLSELESEENVELKGFGGQDPATQDYCAYIIRIPGETPTAEDTSDYPVEFYFGRIYDEDVRVVSSVDVCLVTRDRSGAATTVVVRTVDDYMSDEYTCYRTFDYYGNVREVVYSHSETIGIPHALFAEESGSGTIELIVRATGTENVLSSIDINYAYEYKQYSGRRFLEISWR